jgi:hypothetical protein
MEGRTGYGSDPGRIAESGDGTLVTVRQSERRDPTVTRPDHGIHGILQAPAKTDCDKQVLGPKQKNFLMQVSGGADRRFRVIAD